MALWVLVGSSGIALAVRAGETPVPVGSEFVVSSYATYNQQWSKVDMALDGRFVVTWTSDPLGTNMALAQRFAADGTKLGSEIPVGTAPNFAGDVAIGADGGFVLVWSESGDVHAQLRDSSGTPVGASFVVNSYTTDGQADPSVGLDDSGRFVVIWTSDGSTTDPLFESVQGQRFDSSAMKLGGQFQVNTYTDGFQWFPSMDIKADGDFLVTWHDTSSELDDHSGIRAQRFASDGTRLGGEIQVNTYTTDIQRDPSVAYGPGGDFAVVWWSDGSNGSDDFYSIQGQFFSSDGAGLGDEFQVNSYTTGLQEYPAVAAVGESDFVVAWFGNYLDPRARRIAPLVGPVGSEFQVPSLTTQSGGSPAIAGAETGDFVVTWNGVFGRRFRLGGVFADGFESGNTSAWTTTVD